MPPTLCLSLALLVAGCGNVVEEGGEVSLQPSADAAQGIIFRDVDADSRAYPFITGLAERNIINGFEDGTFRP